MFKRIGPRLQYEEFPRKYAELDCTYNMKNIQKYDFSLKVSYVSVVMGPHLQYDDDDEEHLKSMIIAEPCMIFSLFLDGDNVWRML